MSNTAFDEIADNLEFLENWEDRYRYIIELGRTLAPLAAAEHNEKNKVHGCTSQVWLVVEEHQTADDLLLTFRGDSDAMIVKGLVAILIALFSHATPRQIVEIDAIAVLDRLGLREHLTSQRSNGLVSMVERVQAEAQSRLV